MSTRSEDSAGPVHREKEKRGFILELPGRPKIMLSGIEDAL
jgi:hypothetical protein